MSISKLGLQCVRNKFAAVCRSFSAYWDSRKSRQKCKTRSTGKKHCKNTASKYNVFLLQHMQDMLTTFFIMD